MLRTISLPEHCPFSASNMPLLNFDLVAARAARTYGGYFSVLLRLCEVLLVDRFVGGTVWGLTPVMTHSMSLYRFQRPESVISQGPPQVIAHGAAYEFSYCAEGFDTFTPSLRHPLMIIHHCSYSTLAFPGMRLWFMRLWVITCSSSATLEPSTLIITQSGVVHPE